MTDVVELPASVEQLFTRFIDTGDTSLLGEVFDRVAPRLLVAARRIATHPADAEDVVQTTFLVAIEGRRNRGRAPDLGPWLDGILRDQARRSVTRREPPPDAGTPVDAELGRMAHAALADLPDRCRPVLTLHVVHDMSSADIAEALDRTQDTVRTELARGLELLRRQLPAGAALAASRFGARGWAAVREETLRCFAPPARKIPWRALRSVALGVTAVALVVTSIWRASGSDEVAAAGDEAATTRSEPTAQRPLDGNDRSSVLLELVWVDGTPAREVAFRARRLGSDPLLGAIELRTDAAGYARLPEGGEWLLSIDRGFDQTVRTARGSMQRVALRSGIDIIGRVVDAAGEPLADAEIWLGFEGSAGRRDAQMATRSGPGGAFELPEVQPRTSLLARVPGHVASAPLFVQDDTPPGIVELRLGAAGASLVGEVVDARGHPVAGAVVIIGDDTYTAPSFQGVTLWYPPAPIVRTNAHGRFVASGLAGGVHPIRVRAPGFAPWTGHYTVDAGQRGAARIELSAGASLAGLVVDPSGRPLAGARIVLEGTAPFESLETSTDSAGSFELTAIPTGPLRLSVEHDGHANARRLLHAEASAQVVATVELRPWQQQTIGLVDAGGSPLEGWTVRARSLPVPDEPDTESASATDAGGWATLDVDPARSYRLMLLEPEHGLWSFVDWHEPGPPATWPERIVVAAEHRATARAELSLGDGFDRIYVQIERGVSVARLAPRPDESRRIHLPPIPPGPHAVTVLAPGEPPAVIDLGRHEFRAEHTLELGEVTAAGCGTLACEVGARPEVIPRAVLGVYSSDGRQLVPLNATRGRHELRLWPGDYELRGYGDDVQNLTRPFEVLAGETTEVELELLPGTRRRLAIIVGDDLTAEPATVTVRDPDGERTVRLDTVLRSGWPVCFDAILRPGQHSILAELTDGKRFTGSVTIADLEPSHRAVRVHLTPVQ